MAFKWGGWIPGAARGDVALCRQTLVSKTEGVVD